MHNAKVQLVTEEGQVVEHFHGQFVFNEDQSVRVYSQNVNQFSRARGVTSVVVRLSKNDAGCCGELDGDCLVGAPSQVDGVIEVENHGIVDRRTQVSTLLGSVNVVEYESLNIGIKAIKADGQEQTGPKLDNENDSGNDQGGATDSKSSPAVGDNNADEASAKPADKNRDEPGDKAKSEEERKKNALPVKKQVPPKP